MTDSGLRPSRLRSSWVQINSDDDVHSEDAKHNPCDFRVNTPNTLGSTNVWRVVPHTIAIPNAFDTFAPPYNRLRIWERKIIRTLREDGWWMTLDPDWTVTDIVFPRGRCPTLDAFSSLTNNLFPSGRWDTYTDFAKRVFVIRARPYSSPSHLAPGEWGVPHASSPPGPEFYPGVAFLEEPEDSHIFDIFGFGRRRFDHSSGARLTDLLPRTFDENNPSTASCILGSNLESAKGRIIPLFDTTQNPQDWFTYPIYLNHEYFNPLNLTNPVWVNVVIEELGDNTTIDTNTGGTANVIAAVCLPLHGGLEDDYGPTYTVRIASDCEVEAIQFRAARIIRTFTVKLKDPKGRQLSLPRNFPVIMRLQLLHEEV